MSKKTKSKEGPKDYVRHPRYGNAPHPSGLSIPEAAIRQGFWGLVSDTIFPETVLVADPAKQNYSVFPRLYYVDVARTCRSCQRPFIFSAREQRYWFETLHFWIDADCVQCVDCRRESRAVQRRLRRYSDVCARTEASDKELMFLVDDALYLLERDVLKNLNTLGALKNRALKAIPQYPGVAALADVIGAAKLKQST
jgi:hypothetical protein